MQAFATMVRLGPVWSLVRFIWTIKGIVSIVLLAGTFLGYIGSELIEQRRTMLKDFSVAQNSVLAAENDFRIAGQAAFKGPSKAGDLITAEQVQSLEGAVAKLRSTLIGAMAPNRRIERARAAYVGALTDLQGKLNLFSPDLKGTEQVLTTLVAVENPADTYHDAAAAFQTSVWPSLWAAF